MTVETAPATTQTLSPDYEQGRKDISDFLISLLPFSAREQGETRDEYFSRLSRGESRNVFALTSVSLPLLKNSQNMDIAEKSAEKVFMASLPFYIDKSAADIWQEPVFQRAFGRDVQIENYLSVIKDMIDTQFTTETVEVPKPVVATLMRVQNALTNVQDKVTKIFKDNDALAVYSLSAFNAFLGEDYKRHELIERVLTY